MFLELQLPKEHCQKLVQVKKNHYKKKELLVICVCGFVFVNLHNFKRVFVNVSTAVIVCVSRVCVCSAIVYLLFLFAFDFYVNFTTQALSNSSESQ